MPALRAPKLALNALRPPEPRSAACLNCDTPLTGPFCPSCGQRDIPPYPSVRELVIDAFWELSGWDGRFASTVRALFRRPGMLTREFLEGRRVRYLSPLRLYLMASLVYFVLAAMVKPDPTQPGVVEAPGIRIGTTTTRPQRVSDKTKIAMQTRQPLTAAERDSALRDIEKAPAIIRPFARRAIEDPAGYRRGILETMPRLLFILLPVFAAVVALFYHGRKYPEHLYFAIHLHSFVFLALGVHVAAKLTGVHALASGASLLALIWIPVYATKAFRRVYGGSLGITLAKEAAIGFLYAIAGAVGMVAMVFFVALWG